ncbi:MAG: ABC transporter ATP-binding protein [Parasporobacterium sp.]|nr:ABC transporter ATP-binding protein [Parasporobacterium sp.]
MTRTGKEDEYYIKTQNLSVGYDGKALIEEVNFSVKRGEVLTLIGPNGSGKSTILKTIVGQLKRIAGVVLLEGGDIRERTRNEIAKKMAILMTERLQPELMTCRDMVSTGRYPYTGHLGLLSEEDKKIVEDALRQVDGLEIAERPFTAISDGQRQRILLARALSQQPEIIILDEPTSFLDIRYKLELLSILKKMVREKNLAVIMSLHELDLAERVSDLVVCVNGDRIDKVGPPEEIFTSDYIARLYHMEPGRYDPCFDTLEFVPR